MKKLNYLKNKNNLTDYNYSFCDESQLSNKENLGMRGQVEKSWGMKIQDLQKVVYRQWKVIGRHNRVIQKQSRQIASLQRMISQIYQERQIELPIQCMENKHLNNLEDRNRLEAFNPNKCQSREHSKGKMDLKKKKRNI